MERWGNWFENLEIGADEILIFIAIVFASIVITSIMVFLVILYKNKLAQAENEKEKIDEEVERLRKLYADPIRREAELGRLNNEISQHEEKLRGVASDIDRLRSDYTEKRQIYERLKETAAIYDETIQLAEIGFYQPHFRFDDSEDYKRAIKAAKDAQKGLVKEKRAVLMGQNWEVGGSRAEGKKLVNRTIRLTLRAFNNECDAAIANVTWRNAEAMRQRIAKAFEQINKENAPLGAEISTKYLELKRKELELTVEREEKRKEEREAAAELRRQEREEKKLQEEAKRAEQEEQETEKKLARAKAQAEKAVGEDMAALNAQVEELQRQLEEAHARTERAKSMAEQTKLGHVYVISNQGSFGADIFKIGLTRRLDPHDRIKELGDASVPFTFDTHALIFSEEAPALEAALHAKFENRRVNAANSRKEFFRVTLDEVENAVVQLAPAAEFYRDAEAQEYHETLMLQQKRAEEISKLNTEFPAEI